MSEKVITSGPLTTKEARKIRDSENTYNGYVTAVCGVLGSLAGAAIGNVIGAGIGTAAGTTVSAILRKDSKLDDLMADLDAKRISSIHVKTTMRYRNAGKNSGWYVYKTEVVPGKKGKRPKN